LNYLTVLVDNLVKNYNEKKKKKKNGVCWSGAHGSEQAGRNKGGK